MASTMYTSQVCKEIMKLVMREIGCTISLRMRQAIKWKCRVYPDWAVRAVSPGGPAYTAMQ